MTYVRHVIPVISGMVIHVNKHVLMAHGLNQTHALVNLAYLIVPFVRLALHVIRVVQLTSRKIIYVHKHVLQENMQIVQQVLVKVAKSIVSLAKVMLYVIHVFQRIFGMALNALKAAQHPLGPIQGIENVILVMNPVMNVLLSLIVQSVIMDISWKIISVRTHVQMGNEKMQSIMFVLTA